jgi:hypothetical protein
MAGILQHGPHLSGQNVLWQNTIQDHDRGQADLEGKVRELNLT